VLTIEGIMQIYSGIILVKSVLDIRRYFVEREATSYINTGMLLRHALTFGIYLTTTAAYNVSFALYTFTPNSTQMYTIVSIVGLVYIFGGIISQLLLVNVFWSLGTKPDRPTGTSFLNDDG
jgi:hypothetical protein